MIRGIKDGPWTPFLHLPKSHLNDWQSNGFFKENISNLFVDGVMLIDIKFQQMETKDKLYSKFRNYVFFNVSLNRRKIRDGNNLQTWQLVNRKLIRPFNRLFWYHITHIFAWYYFDFIVTENTVFYVYVYNLKNNLTIVCDNNFWRKKDNEHSVANNFLPHIYRRYT